MDSSVKYAFGILAVVALFAALITFLEQFTGRGEASYVNSCFLVFVGSGLGFFAWAFSSAGATECKPDGESANDQFDVATASADSGSTDD